MPYGWARRRKDERIYCGINSVCYCRLYMLTVGFICSRQDHIQTRGGAVMLYTVWVGGVEVADYFVRREDAEDIAEVWRNIGHDDVAIKEVCLDA